MSRVFTPGASVSPQMRARVLAAAEALDYRPNALARSLITGRSRLIGLVLAYLDNLYYPLVLERLCAALQAHAYHVMIFIAPQASTDVERVLAEVLDHQVSGIVMASAALSSTLATRCAEQGVPVVQFNRAQDDSALSAVTSDNVAGGRTLARFLAAGGHQRIAYIAGFADASTQRDREAGFLCGLADAGKSLFARESGNYNFAGAQEATRRMFAKRRRPDAVFVANDHMAIATMDVLRSEFELRVPEDVSVVSYDDSPPAAWASYELTGIRQPTDDMVRAVVEILMERIERAEAPPRRVVLPGTLVVRRSARIPKEWVNEGL